MLAIRLWQTIHARSEVTNTLLHVQQSPFVKPNPVQLSACQSIGVQFVPPLHAHSSFVTMEPILGNDVNGVAKGADWSSEQGRKLGSTVL